jgi:multidrug efflux pump subunit AcrA (membrane-fusion protein)
MSGLFRAEVMAQQQQQRLQGEVSLTQPASFIALTGLIITLVLSSFAFLYFSEYRRKELVLGTFEPVFTAVELKSLATSGVGKVLVQVGDVVEQGEPLIQWQTNIPMHESTSQLRAPFSGSVTDILWSKTRFNGSSPPSVLLLPKPDSLLAVVYVPASIINQVILGQVLQMRIDAFPYQRFGVQEATVIELAKRPVTQHDSVPLPEPSYRVILALINTQDFALKEGMRLEADISTPPRRLLTWLFEASISREGEI